MRLSLGIVEIIVLCFVCDATSAVIPNPPQYVDFREVNISIISVTQSPVPATPVKYFLQKMDMANKQDYKTCEFARENNTFDFTKYPCLNTWNVSGEVYDNFTFTLTKNSSSSTAGSGGSENVTIRFGGNVSTTVNVSTFTVNVEPLDLVIVFNVSILTNLIECGSRRINFSDSSTLITNRINESFCFSTYEVEETAKCYQQMNPSTGYLKNTCTSNCGLTVTGLNETADPKICVMSRCNSRRVESSIVNVCGPGCYEQINATNGQPSGRCDDTCPDARTEQNPLTGKCEMKICGYRKPTTASKMPCGYTSQFPCFKQINSSTGAELDICRDHCDDARIQRQNTVTGKCVMKSCVSRTPNIDLPNPCGALCELLSNLTCQGVGGSDVDGDGEGEDEETPVVETPEVVEEGDPWKNLKTTLAVGLPIVAVISVLILVVCIVLVVLNAPEKEKKASVDTTVEDGEIPVFPWKGKSPAPSASPALLSTDQDTNPAIPAEAGTSVTSTETTLANTPTAPAGSADTSQGKRKSTRAKSIKRKSKKLADQEDD